MPICAMRGCSYEARPGSAFCLRGGPLTHGVSDATRPVLTCPRCARTDAVTSRVIAQRRGVACWKVASAVVTFGWSVLAVGLSRRRRVVRCDCAACGSRWTLER